MKASRALRETVGLDRAVASAVDLVNTEETLIMVTADHSHTLAIGGYNDRFADITREVQRKCSLNLKGLCLILSDPTVHRWYSQVHNCTLENFI